MIIEKLRACSKSFFRVISWECGCDWLKYKIQAPFYAQNPNFFPVSTLSPNFPSVLHHYEKYNLWLWEISFCNVEKHSKKEQQLKSEKFQAMLMEKVNNFKY